MKSSNLSPSEINQLNLTRKKLNYSSSFNFFLVKVHWLIYWFSWETNLTELQWQRQQLGFDWLAQIISTKIKCRLLQDTAWSSLKRANKKRKNYPPFVLFCNPSMTNKNRVPTGYIVINYLHGVVKKRGQAVLSVRLDNIRVHTVVLRQVLGSSHCAWTKKQSVIKSDRFPKGGFFRIGIQIAFIQVCNNAYRLPIWTSGWQIKSSGSKKIRRV